MGFLVHRRLHYDFDKDPSDFCEEVPDDAIPTEARLTRHTWIIPRQTSLQAPTPNPLTPTTVLSLVATLQDWEAELLKEIQFT